MHGTGGNKSPKQGFVPWLKEISDGAVGKGGKGSGKGKGKGKGAFHEAPRPGRFRSVNKGPGCDSSLERASSRVWTFLDEQGAPEKARGFFLSGCSAASAIEAVRNATTLDEARDIALGKDQEFTSLPSLTVLENGVTSWVQRATVDGRIGDLMRRLLSIADLDDVLAGRVPSLEAESLAAGARDGTYRNVSAFANAQIRLEVPDGTSGEATTRVGVAVRSPTITGKTAGSNLDSRLHRFKGVGPKPALRGTSKAMMGPGPANDGEQSE
ncbi:hypothetical protein Pmar_PMAR003742 [Perkinsus marinus ATCC 50983]|uniref:Uncharacterized protein n=1 Tax=Perkinsus marinus (strain ATCC 50983 / TXsc) TaxID=423536 RepID=C5KI66_PERM5|nr:hypothetical protein Pmar_PMAR003742 [Perkinsus marinus ATCC 50983]EER16278.1 hypothetical protein Pmar_PMAR003742 [Perkinsus marinus ATCC 50983]|eukprot:XP_002784482.1 hypothetical protein Pmar_PMAR003742 [Perkinsus marinus ATCC 50983]